VVDICFQAKMFSTPFDPSAIALLRDDADASARVICGAMRVQRCLGRRSWWISASRCASPRLRLAPLSSDVMKPIRVHSVHCL
jgi:hypothetical protein